MAHLPDLLTDLAMILGAAGVVTILFKWLRQPVVLGYILAGLLVGPHFPLFPTVKDAEGVRVWAEAGVVFLLFGLGLEFSFRKLARVGVPAGTTAVVEVLSMLGLGYAAGRWMGWSGMDSLFLGGILSISSTTIIIRAFEELRLKSRGFANLVFGVLIVEDLVAILLLVLLSTVAATQSLQGAALMAAVGKLGFFLTLWFVAGIFLIPSFLRRVRVHLSEETTVVISVALCLLMVLLATKAGFSPALGAFIMGSILAETPEAERIEHLTRPIKDLFAAVFFVSVGMLIDPTVLRDYAGPIAALTVLTIAGKIVSSSMGAMIAGRSLKQSLQAGFSLAQIGEFSFIIATLGLTLKVTSPFLYPIAVAVSAITTFTTPYLIRSSDGAARRLEQVIPETWLKALARYQAAFQSVSTRQEWREVTRSYMVRLALNGVIVIAIFLSFDEWLRSLLIEFVPEEFPARVITAGGALFFSTPFLWAMALSGAKMAELQRLVGERNSRAPLVTLLMARVVVSVALTAVLMGRLTNTLIGTVMAIMAFVIMAFASTRRLERAYGWLEGRFLGNLGARDEERERAALAPWDAHLVELAVEPNSPCIGRTLMDLKIRETYGVTVALIERGRKRITAPDRSVALFPGDRLAVIGTDEQIQRFAHALQEPTLPAGHDQEDQYHLERVELGEELRLFGKTIRDSGLRELTKGLVVGIERQGRRILNPDSTTTLERGDVLWIVGDPLAIRKLK